ncbi:MAG: type IV toxin-antitoxin system AbiEi family antitoxin domain-containing protein [Actinomycetota bacterium]
MAARSARRPARAGFDRRVSFKAARQHGVVLRADVIAAGGTRTMIASRVAAGRWERLLRGVYRIGAAPDSAEQRALAACFAAGADPYVTHLTAASLWRLGSIVEPDTVHLRSTKRTRAPGVTWHRGWDRRRSTFIGAIPIATAEATIVDLASVITQDALEHALDDGLRRGLVRLSRLDNEIDDLTGRRARGIVALRAMVAARRGKAVVGSPLETHLLRALSAEGLPPPARQFVIRDRGRFVGRVDLAYPHAKLAIEAYGREHHTIWADVEHDLKRQNNIINAGWRIIVVTSWTLEHTRAEVMTAIKRALAGSA